ncbi:hypothetical protein [Delftia sp. PS-11]|uniref:hypothetical protein n=1 Tax=Delftia sp. PS-11 TaxID=2767222 RepID=UPI0024548E8E|nr:hypothetical protein [Delftia sp. PS-11]KAJ8745401.1 hypothetical protein H9T68_06265 [Delftia sp. PS-11]
MDLNYLIAMGLGALGGGLAVFVLWMRSPDGVDAERYRWLKATTNHVTSNGERIDVRGKAGAWDEIIDKQRAQAHKENA